MGLDALLAKLDSEAEHECRVIVADAEERAAEIRASAERGAARRRLTDLAKVRAGEEQTALGELRRGRSEARRRMLAARQDLLDRVRSAVCERIAGATTDPEYRASLAAEMEAALRRLPPGLVTVRSSPGLREDLETAARQLLPDGDVLFEEDPGVGVGFEAHADGGRVVIDATLPSRLASAWRREAALVLSGIEP